MHHRKLAFWLVTAGITLLITTGIFFLLPAQPVSAQCGSQASSCKNCHETQAQDPVNNDGTTWHTQHAFGDFCYLCHAGNNQATDKVAAHTGMVDPLKDVISACKSCHAADFQAKAQIYATTLGVTVSVGSVSSAATPASAQSAATTPAAPAAASSVAVASVPAASMVDYTQRYDQIVLGQQPLNLGNIILIVMIAAMLFGGGYFVLSREHWIRVSFQETKQMVGNYPADVVDMVPQIANLKASARADLRKIIAKPATAAEVFALVNKLSGKEEPPSVPAEPKPEE